MQELTVLAPAFSTTRPVDFSHFGTTLPELPELSLALSRARRVKTTFTNYERLLGELLGLNVANMTDFPVAAYTYFLDTGEECSDQCLRADPVHLQPDRDRVIMVSAKPSNLSLADAEAVAGEINRTYADEPWYLVTPHPLRWYILLKNDPGIKTTPTERVIGQNIYDFLPTGPDQAYWRSIINEIQMLLHSHRINTHRSGQNLENINSLWIWGGGKLPDRRAHPGIPEATVCNHVWSNEALSQAIAKYHHIPCDSLPQNAQDWLDSCRQCDHAAIITDDFSQNVDCDRHDWLNHLVRWHEAWLKPLVLAVSTGRIRKLNIHFGNEYIYTLSRRDMKRWWRFKRPWFQHSL